MYLGIFLASLGLLFLHIDVAFFDCLAQVGEKKIIYVLALFS